MAMYTLIEINGDHLSDMLGKPVGTVLAAIVRNTPNAPRVLEEFDLYRVLRVVKQSGERFETSAEYNVRKDREVEAVLRTDQPAARRGSGQQARGCECCEERFVGASEVG
jgi:hypothetical protein